MAPSAAPPGGLPELPDPTSAAPPQLATPPAAGAPPAAGHAWAPRGSSRRSRWRRQRTRHSYHRLPRLFCKASTDSRQDGDCWPVRSVAGGNAVPTSEPPAAITQGEIPHTGAAGGRLVCWPASWRKSRHRRHPRLGLSHRLPHQHPRLARCPPRPEAQRRQGDGTPNAADGPLATYSASAAAWPDPRCSEPIGSVAAASIIAHNHINRGGSGLAGYRWRSSITHTPARPRRRRQRRRHRSLKRTRRSRHRSRLDGTSGPSKTSRSSRDRTHCKINQNLAKFTDNLKGWATMALATLLSMVPGPDGQTQKKDLGKDKKAALTPEEEARQRATGGNTANLGPTNPMGAPAAATLPRVSPLRGYPAPVRAKFAGISAKEAESAIPLWQTHVADWTKGIQPAQQAEQRLLTIGQAFKSIQTGTWATEGADLAGALKSDWN